MSDITIKCGNENLVVARESGEIKSFNGLLIENASRKQLEDIQKAISGGTFGKVKGLDEKEVKTVLQEAGKWLLKRIDFVTNNKFALKAEKLNNKAIASFASNVSISSADDKASVSDFKSLGSKIYSGLVDVYDYSRKIGELQLKVGADLKLNKHTESARTTLTASSEAIGTALLNVKTAKDAINLLQGITKHYAMLPISHKTGGKFSNIFTNIASFFKNICNTIFRNAENTGKVAEFVNEVISTKLSGGEAVSHAALAGIVMYEAGKKNPDMSVIADCIKHMGNDFKAATKAEDKSAIAESINMAVSSLRNLKCKAEDCVELSKDIKDVVIPMMHDKSTRGYLGLMNVMLNKDNPLSIYKQSSNVNKDVNEFVANVLKDGSNFIDDFDPSFVHSMVKELKPDADSLVKIFGSIREQNDTMEKFLNANSKQLSLSDINTLLNLSGEIKHIRAESAVIQKWPFAREITKLRLDLGVKILDLQNENANLNKAVFEGKKEIKQVLSLVGKQENLGGGIKSLENKLDEVGSKIANVGPDGLPESEIKSIKTEIKDCAEGLSKIKKEQDSLQKELTKVEKSTDKDIKQMIEVSNQEQADDIQRINSKLNVLTDAAEVVKAQIPLPTLPEMPEMPEIDLGKPTMPDDPSIIAKVQQKAEQEKQAGAVKVELNGEPPVEQVEQKQSMSTAKKVAIVIGCVALAGATAAGVVYGVRNTEQIAAAGRLIKGYADVVGKAVVGGLGKVWSGAKSGFEAVKNELKSDVETVKMAYNFAKEIKNARASYKNNSRASEIDGSKKKTN